MSEIDPQINDDAPDARPAWRRRWRLWWVIRAVALIIGAPVLMAIIVAVLLIGREVSAPSWIVRDVEARAAEVLGGGSLGFGAMKVTIGRDLHPQLVLRNAVLRDADGAVLARVPRIDGLISPRGVLQGRVLAQEIALEGAQISLRRDMDGALALSFDQGAAAIGAADGFLGLLEQVDAVFEEGALEALEQIHADGLIINYTDARVGRSWVVDDGRIALDLRGGILALRADVALLSGRSFVSTAQLTYESPRDSRRADIGVAITDAAAADIASQSPLLSWLGVLDAPISGAVRGQLDETGTLITTSATLQIGAGELSPTLGSRPIPFTSARTYLSYDPLDERLTFDLLEVDSILGRVEGRAQTYLREYEDGLPGAILGQVQLSQITMALDGVYDAPLDLTEGNLDFRLRLDPFTLDIGQAVVVADGSPLRMSGQVSAGSQGWSVALDAESDSIAAAQVIALWPSQVAVKTRDWLAENVTGGLFRDVVVAFRATPDDGPDARPDFAVSLGFEGAQVRPAPDVPLVEDARGTLSIVARRMALTLDGGHMTAPTGGRIEMGGSTMVIPLMGIPNPSARFDLAMAGRVTAAMSVLAEPPFNALRNSDLPVSFAQGQARIEAVYETPLGKGISRDQRDWSAVATVRNVRSEVLVPNQTITASELEVRADPSSLTVQGPAQMGDLGGTITFARALGDGSEGTARLEAQVAIGPAFLDTFNITLPRGMVTGSAPAQLQVEFRTQGAPDFRLTSQMRGLGLSLASVGWSKARNDTGALTVVGQLGDAPVIDELSIEAPGLQARGSLRLAAGGGLDRATFSNVRLGGWLNAPVDLVGRGQGRTAGIEINGGSLDLRAANFGNGGGGAGTTSGGPVEIALQSLQVTDSIAIDNFRGSFTSSGGFQGQFSGNVNGAAPINGTLVPVNGRSAVRILSTDAGSLLRATGLLRTAFGGAMSLTLVPSGAAGSYDGTLEGTDLRVRDAPALASLLDAISVVGLLTQLDGQGLMFSDIDAQFRLTPNQVIVTQSSAVGPSLGVSLDGVYGLATRSMDFQGVVSPFYLLNGIGAIFTRPGEGLIGFNFNLRGPVDNPSVSVNPLSVLTPGMFREIFRRPPPDVGQ